MDNQVNIYFLIDYDKLEKKFKDFLDNRPYEPPFFLRMRGFAYEVRKGKYLIKYDKSKYLSEKINATIFELGSNLTNNYASFIIDEKDLDRVVVDCVVTEDIYTSDRLKKAFSVE